MKDSIKKIVGIVLLGTLVILSVFNQWNYDLVYSFRQAGSVFERLSLTDYERHYKSLGPVFEVVKKIEQLPEDAVLYFLPVFPDTPGVEQNIFWWWHLNIILRYFCYPRKILVLHFGLYHDNRKEYIQKYMKGKKIFADLGWIKSRNITHLILYRNNTISILPVSRSIDF